MHSGDEPIQKPKTVAEVEAALKKADRVIPVNQRKRTQNAMNDIVDLILNLDVNQAFSNENIFAGSSDPNVPVKPPKGLNDKNDYMAYLYSDKFIPSQALVNQRNLGRVIGWIKTALDASSLSAAKWISLLQNINDVTSVQDINHIRTALVFYCSSRAVEANYLSDDAALNQELADCYNDFSHSNKYSSRLQKALTALQASELVIQNGAFADKDSILSIVIGKFQQHEMARLQQHPTPSFGLPKPVIRLLVQQINQLINELTGLNEKPSRIMSFFTKEKTASSSPDRILDSIHLLSSMLECQDNHAVIFTFNNNQARYKALDDTSKSIVDSVMLNITGSEMTTPLKFSPRGTQGQ